MTIILNSTVNMILWRGPNDHLMSMRIFARINEYDIHISYENYEESGFRINLVC